MSAIYRTFDPLLSRRDATEIVELCERFGSYGMYSEEGLNDGIGEGLPQRFDAAFNFARTGGRFGRREDFATLASRTNYFRETYAYGDEIAAPGIEPFLNYAGFAHAAREIHGLPLVEPAIVYANILVPGQELAVHTDVPEFRGANRKALPQWLLVVMHHSQLFEAWRMPIATAVSWFHDARGGAFAFYPDGAEAEPATHDSRFNTAVVIDTDSVFHGVDRVAETSQEMPILRPGMRLTADGGGRWSVRDGGTVVAEYRWEEMRFSVSWKAYCFRDEAARQSWRDGSDDLRVDFILDRLEEDLRKRGRIRSGRPPNRELAETLVDEYIAFPKPAST
jgi:hypothetical protein